MKKGVKIAGLVLAGLLGVGVVYGSGWIGDQTVSAETSTEVKGQFAGLTDGGKTIKVMDGGTEKTYPLIADVWVYRNSKKAVLKDLKPGDTLDLILNSKNQVAYIKASGADDAASAAAGTGTASQAQSAAAGGSGTVPQAGAAGSAGAGAAPQGPSAAAGSTGAAPQGQSGAAGGAQAQTPAAGAAPSPSAKAQPAQAAAGQRPWEKLSVELKSGVVQLRMKQDPGASEFFLQTKDHAMIHLKGAEAEQVISLLLQNLPEDRTKWEDGLKQRLSSELKLQDGSPEWKLDVKWKDGGPAPAAVQAGAPGAKDTVQEKAKEDGKAKGKEKEKQNGKEKGKGKGHEDEDD